MAIGAVNNMEYYIIEFVYQRRQCYFIWGTNDIDRFFADNNKILFWKQKHELMDFAKINNIVFEEQEPIRYDLDECEKWCQSLSVDVNCKKVLDMWNIFCDFCNSMEEKFIGNDNQFDEIYDKIFYGNNLPTINKSDKIYIPIFSDEEILIIKKILLSGIYCFQKTVLDNN